MNGNRILLCAFLLLSAAATTVMAQSSGFSGIVRDSSGAVIAGAVVTATNVETSLARTTVTSDQGYYAVTFLPSGNYNITFEAPNFKKASRSAVVLPVAETQRVDVTLEVGDVSQEVRVQANTPALETENAQLGTLVTERPVQELPLNGRNFIKLTQLVAGGQESVPNPMMGGNRPDDRRRTSAFSINGQREYVNNFLIDGMDNNDRAIGTQVVRPPVEAIREFKVLTNLYTAEVGRTGGGVVSIVTKSGSEQFHGSLFEFLRNSALDEKNFFDPPGKTPPFKQNQFGGSLGGPLAGNKTFFFGDYEGLRMRQAQTYVSTVPTPAMKAGNFAGVAAVFDPSATPPGSLNRARFPNDQIPQNRMDPSAVRLVSLYPDPNLPGLFNNFVYNPVKTQREDDFDGRLDHHFSERSTFFARYSFNDANTFLPSQLPPKGNIDVGGDPFAWSGSSLQRSQGLQLNYVRTFSPSLLGEFKAGYVRYAANSVIPNWGKASSTEIGIPGANFDLNSSGLVTTGVAGFRGLGDSRYIPLLQFDNTFQEMANFSYTRSRHTLRFGADVRRRQLNLYQSDSPRGQYNFDANFTNDPTGAVANSGSSIASLLLGFPASTARSLELTRPGYRATEFSGYVQDDWRVKPWLTLNLGLRYDFLPPFVEVADRMSNLDLNAGKVVIAGQNGVSRTAGVQTNWKDFAPRLGFAASIASRTVLRGGYGIFYIPVVDGSDILLANPPFTGLYSVETTPLQPVNRVSQGFPLPTAVDPSRPTGDWVAVSFGLQTPYVQHLNLTVQQDLAAGVVLTAGYVAALGRKQVSSPDINLALPGPGPIGPRRRFAAVLPNVSSITYPHTSGNSNYNSLQITAEKHFRSGLSFSSNYTWSHTIDDYRPIGTGKPGQFAIPQLASNYRLDRGNSDIDMRHRFVFMWNYDLPFGTNLSGPAGVFGKGWQVNGILLLHPGLPFTVFNASPRANTGGSDRPNQVCNGTLEGGGRSKDGWFDTSCFVPQPLFQIGNTGRNTLFAPGYGNLDLSVFKNFTLREQTQIQFRTELFNLTNRVNLGIPQSAFGAPGFGTISNTGNSTARQIQFALKLLF